MKKQPTPKEARDFFQQEEHDWQLVTEASNCGDVPATLAMAMVRLINDEIDVLWRDHDKIYYSEEPENLPSKICQCRQITDQIGDLMKQRRKILYSDYKIQEHRFRIYRDSLKRQMKGKPLDNVISN
jgi:hypothetical protein